MFGRTTNTSMVRSLVDRRTELHEASAFLERLRRVYRSTEADCALEGMMEAAICPSLRARCV